MRTSKIMHPYRIHTAPQQSISFHTQISWFAYFLRAPKRYTALYSDTTPSLAIFLLFIVHNAVLLRASCMCCERSYIDLNCTRSCWSVFCSHWWVCMVMLLLLLLHCIRFRIELENNILAYNSE